MFSLGFFCSIKIFGIIGGFQLLLPINVDYSYGRKGLFGITSTLGIRSHLFNCSAFKSYSHADSTHTKNWEANEQDACKLPSPNECKSKSKDEHHNGAYNHANFFSKTSLNCIDFFRNSRRHFGRIMFIIIFSI